MNQKLLTFMAVFAMALTTGACKKNSGNGNGDNGGNGTPTPSPTSTPVTINRPDLNAVCNRIGDGQNGGTVSLNGKWRHMVHAIAAVYQSPSSLFNNNGSPKPSAIPEIYQRLEAYNLCGVYDGEKLLITDGNGPGEYYTLYRHAELSRFVEAHSSVSPRPKFATWDGVTTNYAKPYCAVPENIIQTDPTCTRSNELGSSPFMGPVNAAIDQLIAEEQASSTGMFDFNDDIGGGTYRINGGGEMLATYLERIAGKLRAQGFCVMRSPGTQDGIHVKQTNASFDYFDLILGKDGKEYIRRYFHSRCTPATF